MSSSSHPSRPRPPSSYSARIQSARAARASLPQQSTHLSSITSAFFDRPLPRDPSPHAVPLEVAQLVWGQSPALQINQPRMIALRPRATPPVIVKRAASASASRPLSATYSSTQRAQTLYNNRDEWLSRDLKRSSGLGHSFISAHENRHHQSMVEALDSERCLLAFDLESTKLRERTAQPGEKQYEEHVQNQVSKLEEEKQQALEVTAELASKALWQESVMHDLQLRSAEAKESIIATNSQLESLHHKFDELQAHSHDQQSILRDTNDELKKTRHQHEVLNQHVEEYYTRRIETAESENERIKFKLGEVLEIKKNHEAELGRLKTDKHSLQLALREAKAACSAVEVEKEFEIKAKVELQEKLTNLDQAYSVLLNQSDEHTRNVAALEMERNQFENQVTNLAKDLAHTKAEYTQRETARDEAERLREKQVKVLTEECKAAVKNRRAAEEELKSLQEAFKQQSQQLAASEQSNADLEQQLKEEQKSFHQKEREHHKELRESQLHLKTSQSRTEHLEKETATLQAHVATLTATLEDAQREAQLEAEEAARAYASRQRKRDELASQGMSSRVGSPISRPVSALRGLNSPPPLSDTMLDRGNSSTSPAKESLSPRRASTVTSRTTSPITSPRGTLLSSRRATKRLSVTLANSGTSSSLTSPVNCAAAASAPANSTNSYQASLSLFKQPSTQISVDTSSTPLMMSPMHSMQSTSSRAMQLRMMLDASEATIDTLRESLSAEVQRGVDRLGQVRAAQEESDRRLATCQKLRQQIEDLQYQITMHMEDKEKLNQQKMEEVARASVDLVRVQQKLRETEEKYSRTASELNSVRQAYDDYRSRTEKDKISSQMDNYTQLDQLMREKRSLESSLEGLSNRLSSLEQSSSDAEKSLQQQLETLTFEHEVLTQSHAASLETASKEKEDSGVTIQALEDKCYNLNIALRSAQLHVAGIKMRTGQREKQINELQAAANAAQVEFDRQIQVKNEELHVVKEKLLLRIRDTKRLEDDLQSKTKELMRSQQALRVTSTSTFASPSSFTSSFNDRMHHAGLGLPFASSNLHHHSAAATSGSTTMMAGNTHESHSAISSPVSSPHHPPFVRSITEGQTTTNAPDGSGEQSPQGDRTHHTSSVSFSERDSSAPLLIHEPHFRSSSMPMSLDAAQLARITADLKMNSGS